MRTTGGAGTIAIFGVVVGLSMRAAIAQDHPHPPAPADPSSTSARDDSHAAASHAGHEHAMDTHAAHAHAMEMGEEPLGIPEMRNGSGTAWQPDATPMHGLHSAWGSWSLMAHWNLFGGYDHQGSDRGDSQWIAPNWGMLMESRALAGGQLLLRQMISLDAVTVSRKGYPLLLQSGETFEGEPLHDQQHPHDLFMEIAGLYTHRLSDALAVQVYAAPSGEPALGPVAFPHRYSASSDPLAVLAHHWQDSTHISFGVLTAGLMTRTFKVEGSWFNGREPDEHRYNFDFHRLDSYSGRVSFNPSESWSFQVSYGYLARPEELHPDDSVHRVTASAQYVRELESLGVLAATAVFGRNEHDEEPSTSSWLLEANYETGGRSVVFGRAENVEKSGLDLALPKTLESDAFSLKSLVGGYVYRMWETERLSLGIGFRASVAFIPSDLEPFYGTRRPKGFMVFLQLLPAEMHGMPMKM